MVGNASNALQSRSRAAGLFTIAVIVVVDLISERKFGEPLGLPDPPIFAVIGIIAYGVIANVCYTGGWIAELIARRVRKGGSAAFALTAFSRGLMFSLFLTLSPALLFAGILCVRILRR